MNTVTKEKLAEFQRMVEADWPNDPMLQEIHLIRLVRQEEMRGMSNKAKAELINTRNKQKPDAA
ncbi:MAG: hypothetical protein ACHQ50_04675 [Fimbriimonadales bacterium]